MTAAALRREKKVQMKIEVISTGNAMEYIGHQHTGIAGQNQVQANDGEWKIQLHGMLQVRDWCKWHLCTGRRSATLADGIVRSIKVPT